MNLPPGYTSRPATRDDLDAIVRLVDAADLHDEGMTDPVRDELLWEWASPGFGFERDTQAVFGASGDLVAYADVHAYDLTVQVRTWTQVHPDHREAGVTAAALEWIEGAARERLPAGTRDLPLRHGGAAGDGFTPELLVGRGFAHVRTFRQMARPLDGPMTEHVVDGIQIRASERGPDDHAVFDVLDGAFRDHFGYEHLPFDAWSEQWFGDATYDPDLVFLALEDGRPAGACQAIVLEGIAWITELGVLEPWRRRGIGRALLERSFAELARRGIGEVRLGVDADNPERATHLYETSGMAIRRVWHIYEKPISAG